MPRDYFLKAKKDGCLALGFSDHCPYPDDDSTSWPGSRMSVEEIPDYINDIKALREKSDFPKPEYVIKGARRSRDYATMFNLNVIDTLDL